MPVLARFNFFIPSEAVGEGKEGRGRNNKMVLFWVRDAFSKEEIRTGSLGTCALIPGQRLCELLASGRLLSSSPYPLSSPLANRGHYDSQSAPQNYAQG